MATVIPTLAEHDRLLGQKRKVGLLKAIFRLIRLERRERLGDETSEFFGEELGMTKAEVDHDVQIPVNERPVKAREYTGRPLCAIEGGEKENLDLELTKDFVRVIKLQKLACETFSGISEVMARAGRSQIIEKGKLSAAMNVDLGIGAYGSQLPIGRQPGNLDRYFGINLSHSTPDGAIIAAGKTRAPIGRGLNGGFFTPIKIPA